MYTCSIVTFLKTIVSYKDTDIPHPQFSKVHFITLHFYEVPTLVPAFTNRNPKGIFAFMKDSEK